MIQDPGLFTDSTGEGIAGGTDVRLSTQKTIYNGSKMCKNCGYNMDPYEALLSELCPTCTRRKAVHNLKGRMA